MTTKLKFKYKDLEFTAKVNYTGDTLPTFDNNEEIEFVELKYNDIDAMWMLESDSFIKELEAAAFVQIDKEIIASKEEGKLDAYLANFYID